MNSDYIINKKKLLYDGFFKLNEIYFTHKKHNGKWSDEVRREVFGGAHVSTVLPYDPIKKRILLVNQFRAGVIKNKYNPIQTEIVAGIIDDGETPDEAARRECFEETGCKIKKLIKVNSYFPAPGSSESYYHFFLGEIDSYEDNRIMGQENEQEDILVQSYTIDQVKNLLRQNLITNGITIIALQWFFLEYYKY
jgi:ADP-ribose pyrophosphatase